MANRSAAQVGAQQTINAAHVIESLAIRTAEQSDATTSANASLTLSSSAAAADYNYISLAATGLATAAKTYADHLADLAQTKADARAQAQRDLTVNQDMPAYQDALDQADQDYDDNLSGYEQTYKSAAGSGLSTDLKAKATAHRTYANQVVPQAHTRRTTADGAAYTFQAAASAQYAWLTQQQAQLDASYWQAKTASLSMMAASFASTQGSPWAAFYATQISAYDGWSQAAAPAQEQRQIAVSRAQAGVDENGDSTSGGETGMQAAERDLLDAAADADEELASELADSAHNREAAAADMASLLLSSGAVPTMLPQLEETSPFTFAITVPGQISLPGFGSPWPIGASGGTTVQDPTSPDTIVAPGSQFLAFAGLTTSGLPVDWNLAAEIRSVETSPFVVTDAMLFGSEDLEIVQPNPAIPLAAATQLDPLEIELDVRLIAELGANSGATGNAPGAGTVDQGLAQVTRDNENLRSEIDQARVASPPREAPSAPPVPSSSTGLAMTDKVTAPSAQKYPAKVEVDGAHVYVKLDMAGFIRGWWNYFTNNGSSTARIAIGTISAGSDAIYLNHMFSQGQFAAKTNVVSKKDFEHFIAVEMKGLVRNSLGSSTPVLSDISQAIKGAQDAWASRVERAWAAAPRDRSLGVALVALPDGSVRSVRRPGLDPSGAKNAYGDALLSHVPGSRVFFPLNQALTPSPSELEVAFLNQFRALAEKELAPGLLTQTLNKLQTVLDVAGMVPALGAIPDLINGGISTARGDKYAASLSFLAVVPAFGDAAGLAKIAKTAEKAIDATKLTDESAMVLKASLAAIADPDQLARAERAAKANVLEAVASGKLQSSTLTQVLGEEAADGILFGQKRIAENFRLYSEAPDFIRGRSIAAVAADLKTGKISPNSLPISYFVWEGKKVAISNRGLAALAEAGMKPTVVKEVPLNEVPVNILRRLDEIPIFRGQTIPGRMIAVTLDKAGTEVLRIITLPD